MKKAVFPFVLFILCCLTPPLKAQDYLVDYTYLGTRTKIELYFLFGQPVDYDVELYKLRYKTDDVHGQPDTASGLLVLPKGPAGAEYPIVMYEHGTTAGPNDVPSKLLGGYQAAMAYASKGFITAAADYLGLGDARGFHPYIHAASEATACFDMLNATIDYLDQREPAWDLEHLFIAGYSQGGHSGAALHKYIQDYFSIIYPVTAATHMSGPYSVSGVMRDKLLSDDNYGYPAYIAYISLGMQEAYGNLFNNITDFFKEPFASHIQQFKDGQIDLNALNSQLLTDLAAGGNTINKRMLQDSVLEKFENDSNYIVNVVLRDNDLYNWAPNAPTRLYYCTGDTQVPFQNSIVADSVMNALGAPDLDAINQGEGLDHGPCALPSIISSINYFLSFLSTGIHDPDKDPVTLDVSPNPVSDYLSIDWTEVKNGFDYQVIDLNGRVIASGHAADQNVSVNSLAAGMYTMLVTVKNETRLARFIRS